MCLSTVYSLKDDSKNFEMDKVATIKVVDGNLVLMDLMGRTKTIPGMVKYVDLLSNEIVCEVG